MADHFAQQIFDAVVTASTGLTTTGANVYQQRVFNVPSDVNYALSIAFGEEELLGDYGYSNTRFVDADLTINITIHVREADGSLDQKLSQIRKELYIALMANYNLNLNFVHMIMPGNTSEADVSAANVPTLSCQTSWKVRYRHSLTDPSIL